jgi:hypothetical protein
MFRDGRVLGDLRAEGGRDVTAGGVSEAAHGRASTDLISLSYQLHVPTNHRRLLAFGSPLLECLDARTVLDTAQQSARAKRGPELASSSPRARAPLCSQSGASTPRSLQMQVRTARNAAPEGSQ